MLCYVMCEKEKKNVDNKKKQHCKEKENLWMSAFVHLKQELADFAHLHP